MDECIGRAARATRGQPLPLDGAGSLLPRAQNPQATGDARGRDGPAFRRS